MLPHTRAMIAAAIQAFVSGRKITGVYDHAAKRHLRIAAEAQGESLQGFDGDRSAKFGGTLPELYDAGEQTFISLKISGAEAEGYDRGSSSAYTARMTDGIVQIFDHGQSEWFAFTVQTI